MGGDDAGERPTAVKLPLTDSGITNDSIRNALVALVGKPLREARALFIPTAMYAMPGGTAYVWQVLNDLAGVGWQELCVLDLTALRSAGEENWLAALETADVLIVSGGNTAYLSYWMHELGLAERLPALLGNTVYVGMSAGGMVMADSLHGDRETLMWTGRYYDDEYGEMAALNVGSDRTLRLVPFVIRPHINSDYFANITFE